MVAYREVAADDGFVLTAYYADRLSSRSSADVARQTRGMFAHMAPGVRLVDELIAERRAEAAAEEAEAREDEATRE